MNTRDKLSKSILIALILFTFIPSTLISTAANASFVESQIVSEDGNALSQRGVDEIKIKRVLENRIVKERLQMSGLSEQQVTEKIQRMSDEEIHYIASVSDDLPSGGDVGFAVGILAIIAFVLLIIYLIDRV